MPFLGLSAKTGSPNFDPTHAFQNLVQPPPMPWTFNNPYPSATTSALSESSAGPDSVMRLQPSCNQLSRKLRPPECGSDAPHLTPVVLDHTQRLGKLTLPPPFILTF